MKTLFLRAAFAAGATAAADATTIDFESLADGSKAGTIVYDFRGLFAQSGAEVIGGAGFNYLADMTVSFSQAV